MRFAAHTFGGSNSRLRWASAATALAVLFLLCAALYFLAEYRPEFLERLIMRIAQAVLGPVVRHVKATIIISSILLAVSWGVLLAACGWERFRRAR